MSSDSKGKGKEKEKEVDPAKNIPWHVDPEDAKKDRERQEALHQRMLSLSMQDLKNRPLRSAQDYLDMTALYQAGNTAPSSLGPKATREEKAAERELRLAHPGLKHRRIFSEWPRDPNGGVIRPENSKLGKMLPNKIQFWGASLFDFHWVRRIPENPFLATVSTTSKLGEWCKEQGEYFARDQMIRFEREPEPELVKVYGVDKMLREMQDGAMMEEVNEEDGGKGKQKEGEVQFGKEMPFSPFLPAPVLQDRIPLHLLPKKLIVHDPFKTLSTIREEDNPSSPWDSHPDLVSTYLRTLSRTGREKRNLELEALEAKRVHAEKVMKEFMENPTAENRPEGRGCLFIPTGTKPGPCPPAVFFMHEAKRVLEEVKGAHLYVSPHELTGTGNHSVVYNVEWELPRSLLVEDVICKKCVIEKGMKILEEEDGADGERKEQKWKELSGRVEETVTQYEGWTLCPFNTLGDDVLDENGQIAAYDIDPPVKTVTRKYHGPVRVIDTGVQFQTPEYSQPYCSHLLAERGLPPGGRESKTVRVSVVAKMSLERDAHLAREANTYQEFPRHFFEHWSGWNAIPPLHDPVPCGALVPQYYGYYVPDEDEEVAIWDREKGKMVSVREWMEEKDRNQLEEDESEGVKEKGVKVVEDEVASDPDEPWIDNELGEEAKKQRAIPEYYTYRSPLLLIENCGESIDNILPGMSIDDRQTCFSLFLRMHHEGWVQGSPYARNILYQPGPLSAPPAVRQQNAGKRADLRETSFRLIDFGRATKYGNMGPRANEEMAVINLFRVLYAG